MADEKKVFKNDVIDESNLNSTEKLKEAGFDIEVKEAITVGTEIEEQRLYEEPASNALMLQQQEAILNSVEVITLEKIRIFAKEVVKSGLSPFKKEADAILVLIRGHELGLPYGVSINNIFSINGKTGMSVHLHKALLLNAGIYIELTEDCVPVYAYGVQKDNPNAAQPKIFVPIGTTTKTKVEGYVVSPQVIDRQTTWYFEREMRMGLSGKIKTLKVTSSYRYSEATQAELIEKDVWKKYTRSLMKARAFTLGASDIASDVIQGMYSINELAMEFNKDFKIDDNMQESMTDISHEIVD
jgi:hypothetical protein